MAVNVVNRAIQNFKTGSFQWNPIDTKNMLRMSGLGNDYIFEFCGFRCSLYRDSYISSTFGSCTVFFIQNTSFPNSFTSCSYTMSFIDCKGNDCLTSKGIIRNVSKNILMTVYDTQLVFLAKDISLRFSWDEDKRIAKQMSEKSIQVDPEIPIALLETLSKDFERYYESKTGTDCLLKVGGEQFHVNRQVLAARSIVFEAMFRHDTLESRSGIVYISDVEANIMSDVLFYVYTGKIRSLTAESVVMMYVVADKYALMQLKDKCIDFMLLSLTLENFCDVAVLADKHSETKLLNKVVIFIEERLEELVDKENWKCFLQNKSVLASRLLCSALRANKVKRKLRSQ